MGIYKSNHNYPSENIVFENDNVIIVEYPNGTATYDKRTGMLISWHGEQYKENEEQYNYGNPEVPEDF